MGFPSWTLFGMALTAFGALVMLNFAYIAQSPRLLKRLGLSGSRFDLRARTLTGYALALLLLAFGFFIAGVPLGNRPAEAEVAAVSPIVDTNESGAMAGIASATPDSEAQSVAAEEQADPDDEGQPSTGAFGGPPPSAQTATAEALAESGLETGTEEPTSTPLPTATPTSTPTPLPTATPSPTATNTPTPTYTPTPIFEETALINTGTSTLWIRRTPGGRDLALVKGGDIVLLLPGHANVGGAIWREVSTVDGTIGWVEESYLGQEIEGELEAN